MAGLDNIEADTSALQEGSASYSITVSYNGAPFHGFARQPGQFTVQGELEQALAMLFRQEVQTVCAGRTDAGVHALGQVVSFDLPEDALGGRSLGSIKRSLNALTDDNIVIRNVEERPAGFSARFDAKAREYKYFICAQDVSSLFMESFSWHIPKPLDIAAMQSGAQHLIGEHDFKSFCLAVSAEGKPTCRCVNSITFDAQQIMGSSFIVATVNGNAFLHSMVRTIVGTLVEVGVGHRSPEWVGDVLQALDRKAAGQNAPAKGLVFWQVEY